MHCLQDYVTSVNSQQCFSNYSGKGVGVSYKHSVVATLTLTSLLKSVCYT